MKKEKMKGVKKFNAFITALEILLVLFFILGYLTQFIVYSTRTIMYFTSNNEYNSYVDIFYDTTLEGNDDEENFEYLYNLTSNYDRDLIKSGSVLNSEISMFAWTKLVMNIVWTMVVIMVCELIRRLTNKADARKTLSVKNQKIYKKIRISITCSFVFLLIANLVIAFKTPFETYFLPSLLIYVIIFTLIQSINYLVIEKDKEKSA